MKWLGRFKNKYYWLLLHKDQYETIWSINLPGWTRTWKMEFQFLKTNSFILIYPLLPQNTLKRGDSIYEKVKQNFFKNCILKVFQDNCLKKQKIQVFKEKTKQSQNFHVCQVFQGWWPPWNKANTLS